MIKRYFETYKPFNFCLDILKMKGLRFYYHVDIDILWDNKNKVVIDIKSDWTNYQKVITFTKKEFLKILYKKGYDQIEIKNVWHDVVLRKIK